MRSKFAILLAVAAVCVTTASAGWTSDSLVTGSPGVWRTFIWQSYAHKVVFGTDGVGHLVWQGGPTSVNSYVGCWYNRYNPGSGSQPGYWGADFAVAPYSTKKKVSYASPNIALDGDGRTIHVVWSAAPMAQPPSPCSVCYRRCTQDRNGKDKWDATLHLYAEDHTGSPVVACVPNEPNHVLVCWHSLVSQAVGYSMVTRFREYVNGAWKQVVRLDSSYMGPQAPVSIAAAPNGDVFVAYPGYDDGTTGEQLFVKTRTNGVWGQPVNVTKSFSSLWIQIFTIEVNPITRNPHVAFERWTEVPAGAGLDTVSAVYHTFRNASGAWLTTPEVISEPHHQPSHTDGYHWRVPTMAFVSNGAAHVVWYDTVPPTGNGIMYSHCSSEGGTWSTPELLTSCHPARGGQFVTVEEPAHAIHVVWLVDYYADRDEIWWKSDYSGGGGAMGRPVALSQSGLELFPNPAKAGRVTVQYSLPRAEPMRVTLLDVSGRAVKTQEVVASERGSFALDMRGLRAGVYILKFDAGSDCLTRKLVIK